MYLISRKVVYCILKGISVIEQTRNLFQTRQSAQWGTYTPDQRYRHFSKSTKYVALTLEMAVVYYML